MQAALTRFGEALTGDIPGQAAGNTTGDLFDAPGSGITSWSSAHSSTSGHRGNEWLRWQREQLMSCVWSDYGQSAYLNH